MTLAVAAALAVLVIALLAVERRHAQRMTLELRMKGDIKRESAAVAQYGQSVVTPIVAWLAAFAYGHDWRVFALVVTPVLTASAACALLKRAFGRMRPNRERAGRFTGFAWRHDNGRESFPSSHSACAFALTVALVHLWPDAAIVFWLLAFATAGLRYVMSAHFPSDVLAGSLLGVGIAVAAQHALVGLLWPHGDFPTSAVILPAAPAPP